MNTRNPMRAAAALGPTLTAIVGMSSLTPGTAEALVFRPTPNCVYLMAHVAPKDGFAGYTRVRNRCSSGRYVKVTYSDPQARVGTCLRADSTYSFSLPWKYRPYRGVRVKALSEKPKTC
jgi:hypothetical protein